MIIDLTGEVVPCCFWSGYGNSGKPLGNTNAESLDEIWNGAAWRELRRRNASGAVEGTPCHKCLAWTWGAGRYPPFELPGGLRREEGHAWIVPLPESVAARVTSATGAAPDAAALFEDGRELGPGEALHDDIRRLGAGRYSVWGDTLYFSTGDNSDPERNGRRYELRLGERICTISALSPQSRSGANLLVAREEYERGAEVMQARPGMISFISTADCNIDCPACSQNTVRRVKVQHRPETERDVLEHVPWLHQFIWHGGEPWLIRGFRDFVANFRTEDNPNLAFGFTSNATLLGAAELARLERFPRINASLSVDSFNARSFERIRTGARFATVRDNMLAAVAWSDPPRRVVSVGMVVLKSNLLELPENLAFAMQHDIGLNLSPVVVYPVTERLDVFEDFEEQTRGWDTALERAAQVLDQARAARRPALRRVDPVGMLEALVSIVAQARRRHAHCVELGFELDDPHGSLTQMRRPGLILDVDGHSVAYATVRGAGRVTLRVPREVLGGAAGINWTLCHDLLEPMGAVLSDKLRDRNGRMIPAGGWEELPRQVQLVLPPFAPVPLPRNASLARAGRATPDGLHVTDSQQIFEAYRRLVAAEAERGSGVLPLGELRGRLAAAVGRRPPVARYADFSGLPA